MIFSTDFLIFYIIYKKIISTFVYHYLIAGGTIAKIPKKAYLVS